MTKPFLEVSVIRPDALKKQAMHHARMTADYRATLAVGMVPTMAHVGVPDGETSSGEPRMRPQTPQELADCILATTELLIDGFIARGWLVEVPALSTCLEDDGPPAGFGGGK